jgi:hypothetical protein
LVLKGDSIDVSDSRLEVVNRNKVIISSGDTYNISGSLTDGQIIVDTQDKEPVQLILNSVNIHCSTSAPICILNAEEAIIFLEAETDNYVSDGA